MLPGSISKQSTMLFQRPQQHDPNLAPRQQDANLASQQPAPNLASQPNGAVKLQTARSHQPQSTFFSTFPAEIRQQIYEKVFGGDRKILHIVRLRLRIGYVRCWDPLVPRLCDHRCWDVAGGELAESRGILPLLQSCWKIYTESIDMLYSQITFSTISWREFISLGTMVSSQRLHTIRSVELAWCIVPAEIGRLSIYCGVLDKDMWERVWRILAVMKGLRQLRVDLMIDRTYGGTPLRPWIFPRDHKLELSLLMPAMAVIRPKPWLITTAWPANGPEILDAPFKVLRCTES